MSDLVFKEDGGKENSVRLYKGINIVGRRPSQGDHRVVVSIPQCADEQFIMLVHTNGTHTIIPLETNEILVMGKSKRLEVHQSYQVDEEDAFSLGTYRFCLRPGRQQDATMVLEGATMPLGTSGLVTQFEEEEADEEEDEKAEETTVLPGASTQGVTTLALPGAQETMDLGVTTQAAPTVPLGGVAGEDDDESSDTDAENEVRNEDHALQPTEIAGTMPLAEEEEEEEKSNEKNAQATVPITQANIDDMPEERLVTQLDEPEYDAGYPDEARTTQSEPPQGSSVEEDDDRGSVASDDILVGGRNRQAPPESDDLDDKHLKTITPPPTTGRRTGPRSTKVNGGVSGDESDFGQQKRKESVSSSDTYVTKETDVDRQTSPTTPVQSTERVVHEEAPTTVGASIPDSTAIITSPVPMVTHGLPETEVVVSPEKKSEEPDKLTSSALAGASEEKPPAVSPEKQSEEPDKVPTSTEARVTEEKPQAVEEKAASPATTAEREEKDWVKYCPIYSGLTVAELRDELKQQGLDFKGKKEHLIERLAQNHREPIATPVVDPSQRAMDAASLLEAMKHKNEEDSDAHKKKTRPSRSKRVVVSDGEEEEELDDTHRTMYEEVMNTTGLTGAKKMTPQKERISSVADTKTDGDEMESPHNVVEMDETETAGAKTKSRKARATASKATEEAKQKEEHIKSTDDDVSGSGATSRNTRSRATEEAEQKEEQIKSTDENVETKTQRKGKKPKVESIVRTAKAESSSAVEEDVSGNLEKSDEDMKDEAPGKASGPSRKRKQETEATKSSPVTSKKRTKRESAVAEEVMELPVTEGKKKKSSSPVAATEAKRKSSPISSAPKASSKKPIRVMFTNIEPTEAHLAAVRQIGGEVIETAKTNTDYHHVTHLICLKNSMKRTLKLLHVMAIPGLDAPRVVHVDWLLNSGAQGKPLSEEEFAPFENENSMKHALRLRDKDTTKGMLAGLTILIAMDRTVQPSFVDLAPIVEQAGGEPKQATAEALKSCPVKSTVVIGTEESFSKQLKDVISKRKIALCKPSWITQSLASYSMKTGEDSIISRGSFFI